MPIISVPSDALQNVHTARFRAEKTLGTEAMYYPAATKAFYENRSAPGTYKDKKILALCGAIDEVVPPAFGADEWNRVRGEAAAAEQWIQEGRGHICTPEMVARAAAWFVRHGLGGKAGDAKL